MDYTIFYPTKLDQINPLNDNIDVCVTLEDGRNYTFIFATPDNLKWLMEKDKLPYLQPGLPFLFVQELTERNIRAVVEKLLENDARWGDGLIRIYGADIP